jgi:catechol 2,3-dioxygenase-like lactoylglutathione lyase family enzyme
VDGVAPTLPSTNLEATSAFYARLGFEQAGLWPDQYLIVMRADVGLHFVLSRNHDPATSDHGCYLYVQDADALFLASGDPR